MKSKIRISCFMTFFPENNAICETMMKNVLQLDGPQMRV